MIVYLCCNFSSWAAICVNKLIYRYKIQHTKYEIQLRIYPVPKQSTKTDKQIDKSFVPT